MEFLKRALLLAQVSGNSKLHSDILKDMAETENSRGNHSVALKFARDAHKHAKLSGNLHTEAQALRVEAMLRIKIGDYRNAILCLGRSRGILKLYGLTGGNLQHITMHDEGQIHLVKSEYAEAYDIHAQILQATSPQQDPMIYAASMLNLAEIRVRVGTSATDVMSNLEEARMLYRNSHQCHHNLIACETIVADLNLREGHTSR
jgi:tetratricopeptide (TPR) repeat protein